MRVLIDPPARDWQWRRPAGVDGAARSLSFVAGGRLEPTDKPIIATGHQAGFWHPGILAKCIAAVQYAEQVGGQAVFVMVDHDVNDPLAFELPVIEGDRLTARTVKLAEHVDGAAVAAQPAPFWEDVVRRLTKVRDALGDRLAVDVAPMTEAIAIIDSADSRAEAEARLLAAAMQPIVGTMPIVLATDMMDNPPSAQLIKQLLDDAPNCVAFYNRAVAAFPDAGVPFLLDAPDRVELPLWWVGEPRGRKRTKASHVEKRSHPTGDTPPPRQRVFADLTDTEPILTLENGEPVPRTNATRTGAGERYLGLAPRALLLTALMRSRFCDLFIHGVGGAKYDRVMEKWWGDWTGEELAPRVTVSADVTLDFDVPVSDEAELARATWWAHHLPHNVDRFADAATLDAALVRRKRELLAHMDDDRDRSRRAAAFHELHRINAGLADDHPHLIAASHDRLARAEIGLANRAVAAKRDWPFVLYPPAKLHDLRRAIDDAFVESK